MKPQAYQFRETMLISSGDRIYLLDLYMPELPSGLSLGIVPVDLFDHGGNWVECPDGHFWYWTPDPEMAPPPYDINGNNKFLRDAKHALVPKTREEAKRFIKVIELNDSGVFGWRGELLHLFPQYTELNEEDLAAWNIWIKRPETDQFIDDFIIECQRLAEVCRHVRGYAALKGTGKSKKDN